MSENPIIQNGGSNMKCKTVVLWWLINDKEPKQLKESHKKIEALMPLVNALFPGINYYSITGFTKVMKELVIPALKKGFPELLTTPEDAVKLKMTTEVAEFLPSQGYEWEDSPEWQSQFEKLLAA